MRFTWHENFMAEPWQQLLREMNRMVEDFPAGRWYGTANYPPVNIWSTDNDATVDVEIPGVHPEEIEINVLQDVVTIAGIRKALEEEKDIEYRRQERPSGHFQRSVKLPFKVDANQVEAKYEKGILHIKLPRSEKDKPKQIKVKSST